MYLATMPRMYSLPHWIASIYKEHFQYIKYYEYPTKMYIRAEYFKKRNLIKVIWVYIWYLTKNSRINEKVAIES